MKLVIAYIRTEFAEDLMMVHGMSGEKQSFLYTKHPFEIDHLPASLKLEVVRAEESVDQIVSLFARIARTGNRGDGVIAVQDIEKVQRIRDVVL